MLYLNAGAMNIMKQQQLQNHFIPKLHYFKGLLKRFKIQDFFEEMIDLQIGYR